MMNRRALLKGVSAATLLGGALAGYACGVEPGLMLNITRYTLTPPGWVAAAPLKIAVVADLHACEPYMSATRIRQICTVVNAMAPDITLVLGDFNGGHVFVSRAVWPEQWAEAISILKAPLGVWAILGNHDWWHGPLPNMRGDEAESVRTALKWAGVGLLENNGVRLTHSGSPFWLLGLADQLAYRIGRGAWRGADDLNATIAKADDRSPVILLAHEPMIFKEVPDRVSLTLSGHTHGGQVNLPFIGSPYARSRFGAGHYYGHVVDQNRHMIISAGLGESIAPIRFMRPPELVEVNLVPSPVRLS